MEIIKTINIYFVSVRQKVFLWAACLLMTFLFAGLYLVEQRPEYQVKAVFLYNFSQFVQWPTDVISEKGPFIIGVLGKDPLGSYLDEAVKGEMANGRPIVTRKYSRVEDAYGSDILFIRENNKEELKNILNKLKGKNILTVSDTRGFAQMGGMIEFFTKENKIALKINIDSARKAQLEISSKLLRLAEIVNN